MSCTFGLIDLCDSLSGLHALIREVHFDGSKVTSKNKPNQQKVLSSVPTVHAAVQWTMLARQAS